MLHISLYLQGLGAGFASQQASKRTVYVPLSLVSLSVLRFLDCSSRCHVIREGLFSSRIIAMDDSFLVEYPSSFGDAQLAKDVLQGTPSTAFGLKYLAPRRE